MDLAQMEAIASDLSGQVADLTGQVQSINTRLTAVEDHPPDSFAPINTMYLDNVGVVQSTLKARESGYAVVNGVQTPVPINFHAPGTLEWENMLTSNILYDTIGALPAAEGIVELPGLFHGVPMPYRPISPGIIAINGPRQVVPTVQERQAGELMLGAKAWNKPTKVELLQLRGKPGTEAKIRETVPEEATVGLAFSYYNSKGEAIGGGGGGPEFKLVFPADGVIWLVIANTTFNAGKEGEAGPEGTITYAEALPASLEIPTFRLYEGFLYNITSQWEFETDEAASASGLFVLRSYVRLLPSEAAQPFVAGEPYSATAIVAAKWGFTLAASQTIWVPEGQPEGYAEAGTAIVKQPNAPGNATEYAWVKQTLIIQQLVFPT